MGVRDVEVGDLTKLSYLATNEGGWRVDAELECARCGAFQAADSDPATKRDRLAELSVRLFNAGGWRVGDDGGPLCPDCAATAS